MCGILVLASVSASAASPKLKKAEDLYDDGSFAQARAALRLLTTDPGLGEKDRAQARLYLAASEFALGDAVSAKKELKTLAVLSPDVKPDPNVFLPDFVALADAARKEAGVSDEGGHHRRHRRGEGEVAKTSPTPTTSEPAPVKPRPETKPAPTHEVAKAPPPTESHPVAQATPPAPSETTSQPTEQATRPVKPATQPDLVPAAPERNTPPAVSSAGPEQEEHGSSLRTWAYVGYGVAGAAAIASGLFYLQAKSSAQDAANATNSAAYASARSSVDSKLGTSNVAGIAAAVAAGGATVLLVTSF